jgi:biotin synthase
VGDFLLDLTERVKSGGRLERTEADRLIALGPEHLHSLLYAATEVRRHFRGDSVKTCSIVNARSGRCPEDCAFCAQSARHRAEIEAYPLMSPGEVVEHARKEEAHSRRLGIVTAGKGLRKKEVEAVGEAIAGFRAGGLRQLPCASLGILDGEDLRALKEAGLTRYHHNLEAAREFYPSICTTHTHDDRVATIRAARSEGLEVCVGGIWGMGESARDRVSLLYEIAELDPESVPINFLVPIAGTPLQHLRPISLWEAVKVLVLARLVLPDKDIKLGAGRLEVFRDAQHLVFLAGANGMIVGNLLTVKGRAVADDLAVVNDLGLKIAP